MLFSDLAFMMNQFELSLSLSGLPGVSEVLRGLITGGNVCCVHSSKENKKMFDLMLKEEIENKKRNETRV